MESAARPARLNFSTQPAGSADPEECTETGQAEKSGKVQGTRAARPGLLHQPGVRPVDAVLHAPAVAEVDRQGELAPPRDVDPHRHRAVAGGEGPVPAGLLF